MSERENGPGLGDDPVKLNRILCEISINFGNLNPFSAAVNALIAFEAAPSLSRTAGWSGEPSEGREWQQFQEAKSYFFTLIKIKKEWENGQFLKPEDDHDETSDKESRSNLLGKLHAYEDVLAVLDKLLGEGVYRPAN